MTSKKSPQCSAVDEEELDQPPSICQVEHSSNAALRCRSKPESSQRNGETASSSPDSSSFNGDGKRNRKMRHRNKKRLSNPESRPEAKADHKMKNEERPLKGSSQPPNVHAGFRSKPESSQRNGETASSSPDSGSFNGDGKRNGKMRHRNKKRLSNPEKAKADIKMKDEEKPMKRSSQPPDVHAGLVGLQSECANVWFERSIYERAESLYQRWLVSSSYGTQRSNRSRAASGKPSRSPSTGAPPSSSSEQGCHHGDRVACHHVVEAVWVNKTTFDQAERRFVEESVPSSLDSLDRPSQPNCSITPRTPDEGHRSPAPTPATHEAVVPPTNRRAINGLPRIPVDLLRDVWLDKPLYDRAEAAFYQNLYGSSSSKRSGCSSAARSTDHPQSLVEEEEEEEEEEEKEAVVEGKRVILQGKAEVFHALLPIQEEEEPAEVPEKDEVSGAQLSFLIHPDSERVWLDRWRYDAAESRFHVYNGSKAAVKKRRPASVASAAPPRDNTMTSVDFLAQERIWFDKPLYDKAERCFYERMNGSTQQTQAAVGANTILQDIARARENIQKSLAGSSSGAADQGELVSRVQSLELENHSLYKVVDDLRAALSKLECRVADLEKSPVAVIPAPATSAPHINGTAVQQRSSAPVKEDDADNDDDDIDLFGSDEDEEVDKLKEERLKAYAEKKAKKPGVIAKSSILLDVKPWDDETDMVKLEECVRSVQADGLLWGSSKLVPVGYGIKKLQIACVVEDDKVGTDMLEEEITKFEDYVQSVDVAAFNKI